MKKEKFLNLLRKRLNILEDSEIEDIINEYEGYIDEKVKAGLTEEEAVAELGNIDEIINDLLAAYKLKSNPRKANVNNFFNKLNALLDCFMEYFSNKSFKDILRIIMEIIIIFLLIWIMRIPFVLVKEFISHIFLELPTKIGSIFNTIWCILVEVSYVLLAIVFFFKMFEKRVFFKDKSLKTEDLEDTKEKMPKTSSKEEIKHPKKTTEGSSFIDSLTDIGLALLKLLAIIIFMIAICYLLGVGIALGVMVYLIFKGVTYFGILIFIIALLLAGIFILEFLFNFIFNKKIKALPTFIKLVAVVLTLGLGLSISAVEIANTEIIYDNKYNKTKTITKEIAMKKELVLYNYDKLVVDDTLGDIVKIEYIVPDYEYSLQMEVDLEKCGKGYCLETDIEEFRWNRDLFNIIINNLKNHQIYAYDFSIKKIVYANSTNLEKLKSNRENNDFDEYVSTPYNFTKTYFIKSISDTYSKYYYNVTLYQFQEYDVETVRIPKELMPDMQANKYYEFTFEVNHEIPDEDIDDIFEKCKLINIKLTNKTGLDQVNESIKGY